MLYKRTVILEWWMAAAICLLDSFTLAVSKTITRTALSESIRKLCSALSWCATSRYVRILSLLFDRRGDIDGENSSQAPAMVWHNYNQVIKVMIASIQVKDSWTLLISRSASHTFISFLKIAVASLRFSRTTLRNMIFAK